MRLLARRSRTPERVIVSIYLPVYQSRYTTTVISLCRIGRNHGLRQCDFFFLAPLKRTALHRQRRGSLQPCRTVCFHSEFILTRKSKCGIQFTCCHILVCQFFSDIHSPRRIQISNYHFRIIRFFRFIPRKFNKSFTRYCHQINYIVGRNRNKCLLINSHDKRTLFFFVVTLNRYFSGTWFLHFIRLNNEHQFII